MGTRLKGIKQKKLFIPQHLYDFFSWKASKAYGVSGQLLTWFANYLSGRLQRVVIDGATSQWASVTSGVPQGSLLGPLLFIIFITDLPDVAIGDVFTSLYADDTKVYRNINTIEDCMSLQKTLTNMDTWTRHNNIQFLNARR